MKVEAMAKQLFEVVEVGIGCVGVRTPSGVLTPCGKMPTRDSALCPKCQVVADYQGEAPKRRAEKARLTLEARRAKDQALRCSPLAAVNPELNKPVQSACSGYDDTERTSRSLSR